MELSSDNIRVNAVSIGMVKTDIYQKIKHHLGLFEKGIVKLAGPLTDDTGGAAVMEASSLEEINGMISLDPAVTNKVFAYDVHPWSLIAGERYIKPGKK